MTLTKIKAGHYVTANGDSVEKASNAKWFFVAVNGKSSLAVFATRAAALEALAASEEAEATAEERIEQQVAGSLADDKVKAVKVETGRYVTADGDTVKKMGNGKWILITASGQRILATFATRAVALASLATLKAREAAAERRIERIAASSPADRKTAARAELTRHGVPLGQNYFRLNMGVVERILAAADAHGYRKSPNAPGSRARMFYEYANR